MPVVTVTFSFDATVQGWGCYYGEADPSNNASGRSLSWIGFDSFVAPGAVEQTDQLTNVTGGVVSPIPRTDVFYLGVPFSPAIFGISAGSTINSIQFLGARSKGDSIQGSVTAGQVEFHNSSGFLDGTTNLVSLSTASRSVVSSESSWSAHAAGSSVAGSSLGSYQTMPASSFGLIGIKSTINWSAFGPSAISSSIRWDEVSFQIDYTGASNDRTGSGALSRHPTLIGSGIFGPAVVGSGSLSRHPTLSGSAIYGPPVGGVAALVASQPILQGVGSSPPPQYSGSAALIGPRGILVGSGSFFGASTTTLFIAGAPNPSITAMGPLSVTGTIRTTGTQTLFLRGPDGTIGSIPLVVAGPMPVHQGLNLVVATDPAPFQTGQATLWTCGDDGRSRRGAVWLSVTGAGQYPLTGVLNLSITGVDSGGVSEPLNLVVRGGNPAVVGVAPLYLRCQPLPGGQIPLLIVGDGLNPGFMPGSESLNLVVARGPNAGLTLYLAQLNVAGSLPLFVAGQPLAQGSVPFVVTGDGGVLTGSVPLSIPVAADFQPVTGSAPLVIPAVRGLFNAGTTLWVGGWSPA